MKIKRIMIKNITSNFLEYTALLLLKFSNYITSDDISMSKAIYTESGRYLKYIAINNKLLTVEDLLRLVYNRLLTDSTFRNFGEKKVIMISAKTNLTCEAGLHRLTGEPCLHPNVLITNTTTFEDYYSRVKIYIKNELLDDSLGYGEVVITLNIKIWNLDKLIDSKPIVINKDKEIIS